MRIPIMNLDSIGIIKDVSPQDLPLSAFSDGKNVRFENGRVQKATGYELLYTPNFAPYYVFSSRWANDIRWVHASRNWIYQRQLNGTFDNLTGVVGGYNTPNHTLKWQGGHYNGIQVMNNAWDTPQVRENSLQLFTDMTGFPTGKKTRCIRGFKNYFVALEVISNLAAPDVWGTHQVLWSHPTDPGTEPDSWDITDPTKDAGLVYLADTSGTFTDQMTMRGANFLYKDDAVYIMQHIGGNDIFGFRQISEMTGCIATNCVQKIIGANGSENHVVFGPWDIYAHDGQNHVSILDKKMRKWIYTNLNRVNADRAFVAHHAPRREVWFCFPTAGNIWPNIALIWNYRDGTTTLQDIPGLSHLHPGPIGYAETQTSTTSKLDFLNVMIGASATNTKIYQVDKGTSFDGGVIDCFLERQGLTVIGKDPQTGKWIQDSDRVKEVSEVYLRAAGTKNTEIGVTLGSQMAFDEPIRWGPRKAYKIGVDQKVNYSISGKIISIKFDTQATTPWTLSGYDLEIKPGGSN